MLLLLIATQPKPTYPTMYSSWRNNFNLTRKVSTTTYPITFLMADDTDHITGKTGLSPTVTLSKNGGGFSPANGAVTELGGGLYALAGNATDRNTLGELWIHAEATGADNVDLKCDITAHDPYADINSILADTSTDGVVLKAAGLADDAVAEIQSGLALEATLEAIKGTGWSDETLVGLMTAIEAGMVDEATIRSAVGLAAANLDTQLSAIDTAVDGIVSDMATVDEVADAIWDEATADHTTTTTFGSLDVNVDAIKAKTDNLPTTPADEATLEAIKGAGWSDETLVALMLAIEAISTCLGATPQEIWEYVSRTLTDASGLGLATDTALSVTDGKVDDIKAKTDNLPAIPAPAGEYDAELAAIQADLNNPDQYKADVSGIPAAVWAYTTRTLSSFGSLVSDIWAHATRTLSAFGFTVATQSDANVTAIKAKTDNLPASPAPAGEYDTRLTAIQTDLDNPNQYKADISGVAKTTHLQEVEDKVDAVSADVDNIGSNIATPASVWAHPDRTLTVSSVRPRPLVDGDQFTIYKDATINIPITKLGDISVYDNLWFTIKREQDLESADDQSVVHMDLLTGMLYLNKQAAVAAQGSITIVDATTGSINILITKEGAALLPVYAREPLRWEVKGIHGNIVDILLQGSCFIQPAVSRKIS